MSENEVVSDSLGGGISRRDALKRGAVVGGAVLWVTPIVQSIAISPASAQSTSAPFPSCSLSHFDLAVRRTGQSTIYGLQFEPGSGQFVPHNTSSHVHCLDLGTFTPAPSDVVADFNAAPDPTNSSTGSVCCLRYTIPMGYVFEDGAAKCGRQCAPAIPVSDQTYDFCCPL